jgi:hypothetical protein
MTANDENEEEALRKIEACVVILRPNRLFRNDKCKEKLFEPGWLRPNGSERRTSVPMRKIERLLRIESSLLSNHLRRQAFLWRGRITVDA